MLVLNTQTKKKHYVTYKNSPATNCFDDLERTTQFN